MASKNDNSSDSLDLRVVDVPKSILGYVKTRIVELINNAKDFSAKVHYGEGQSGKIMISFDAKSDQTSRILQKDSNSAYDCNDTNTILVRNIPESADEELLGFFFESNKKYGGVRVKNVKILSGKNVVIIEFCERKSVEIVLGKRPIKFGKAELEVYPYKPLLTSDKAIDRIDLQGLPREFGDGLELEYFDFGPPLAALMKVGSRVVRGRDWKGSNEDGGGKGTVKYAHGGEIATVKWDTELGLYDYRIGGEDRYEIKLA